MNDEKTGYKILGYIAVGILFTCFLFAGFGKRDETLGELQTNTDTTLGNLKAESSMLGVEVGRIETANHKLEETLARTKSEIDQSRGLSKSIEEGLARCERLVSESQGLIRANSDILKSIDESN